MWSFFDVDDRKMPKNTQCAVEGVAIEDDVVLEMTEWKAGR
jgi:hypothetical protein